MPQFVHVVGIGAQLSTAIAFGEGWVTKKKAHDKRESENF